MDAQRLTKPALVDLLRLCDNRRWVLPKIRYASIRAKGDLIKDLLHHFEFVFAGGFVDIRPKHRIHKFPESLKYHVKTRSFHLDHLPFDCAKISREKVPYTFRWVKTTLYFPNLHDNSGRF
jgi:hypothetical protein